MNELQDMWPDEERRDAALTRLLIRIHTGVDWQRNERNEQRDPGTAAYVAAKAWLRINHRPLTGGGHGGTLPPQ